MQNGFDNFVHSRTLKGMAAGECFIADHAQRKNVGRRRQGLELNLLGRHIEKRPLLRASCVRVGKVSDAEINNLYRIIFHHKYVARLQVAMNQASFVRRLKAAAALRNNFDGALDS